METTQTIRHTVYFVASTLDAAGASFPFFNLGEAEDYASDHGGQVFTGEADVRIDVTSIT